MNFTIAKSDQLLTRTVLHSSSLHDRYHLRGTTHRKKWISWMIRLLWTIGMCLCLFKMQSNRPIAKRGIGTSTVNMRTCVIINRHMDVI